MSTKGLNARQERFCKILAETGNEVLAYKKSGYSQNMSYEAMKVEACRMAQNPNLSLTIAKYQEEWNKRHNLCGDELKAKIVATHISIIDSRVSDLFDVDESTGKVKSTLPTELTKDANTSVKSISRGKDGSISYSLHDKVESCKELARLTGLYSPDKSEITVHKGTDAADVDFIL